MPLLLLRMYHSKITIKKMNEHTFRQGECIRCGVTYYDVWSCSEERMGMSRLSEKLALAAAVAPRQAAKIEARADKLIASEAGMEALTDESFAPHEALLAEAESSLADLKHELATMSNMPPLETSKNSSVDSPPEPPKELPPDTDKKLMDAVKRAMELPAPLKFGSNAPSEPVH
jgi:hypothetical protein